MQKQEDFLKYSQEVLLTIQKVEFNSAAKAFTDYVEQAGRKVEVFHITKRSLDYAFDGVSAADIIDLIQEAEVCPPHDRYVFYDYDRERIFLVGRVRLVELMVDTVKDCIQSVVASMEASKALSKVNAKKPAKKNRK